MLMKDQAPTCDLEPTDANDTAVILYTSGTTGTPKGAELTHANVAMNIQICQGLMKHDGRDVQLVVLPLFHTFGQTVQMNTVVMCGRVDGAHAALRPGRGAQSDAGSQGHDLRRRADDVHRDPQPARRGRASRPEGDRPQPAARRCRAARRCPSR